MFNVVLGESKHLVPLTMLADCFWFGKQFKWRWYMYSTYMLSTENNIYCPLLAKFVQSSYSYFYFIFSDSVNNSGDRMYFDTYVHVCMCFQLNAISTALLWANLSSYSCFYFISYHHRSQLIHTCLSTHTLWIMSFPIATPDATCTVYIYISCIDNRNNLCLFRLFLVQSSSYLV